MTQMKIKQRYKLLSGYLLSANICVICGQIQLDWIMR